jgi:acyl CoA:acetate/3-ketoacid CoA transferase alpha subunit
MCCAGTTTVVEVETFLGDGMIPAQDVHTPGIFVQRVIETEDMR